MKAESPQIKQEGDYSPLITVRYEFYGWIYKEEKRDLDSFNLSLKEFSFFLPMYELNCQRPVR